MEPLTVEQLGEQIGILADKVMAGDWLEVLGFIPVATKAVNDFVSGYQNRPRGARLARGEHEPLVLAAARLDECCRAMAVNPNGLKVRAAGEEGADREFGPAEIMAILAVVQAIGKFIKAWRDRRVS